MRYLCKLLFISLENSENNNQRFYIFCVDLMLFINLTTSGLFTLVIGSGRVWNTFNPKYY